MTTTATLKKSVKMQNALARILKKQGEDINNPSADLTIRYEVEFDERNRNGKYYDYVEVYSTLLQRKWIIAHDGTITRY